MKLQRLKNKVLLTTGKLPRNTPIRDTHISFQIPYAYNYITKLCRQQAQSFNMMRIYMLAIFDKAKHDTEDIRHLNWAVVRHMTVLVIKLPLQPELPSIRHNLLYRPWTKGGLMYVLYMCEL
jgi:hypothetical protein